MYSDLKNFFLNINDEFGAGVLPTSYIFKAKCFNIAYFYDTFIFNVLAYEQMGSVDFKDSSFDEVIEQAEKWYPEPRWYVRYSKDGDNIELLKPYEEWWDDDENLISYFKHILRPDYSLPRGENLEPDIFHELLHNLFALYIFYSEIAPYLLGDYVELYQQEMVKFIKLFSVIDTIFLKTATLAFEHLHKIKWRDSKDKLSVMSKKKQKWASDSTGNILWQMWCNEITDKSKKSLKDEKLPYSTLAKKLVSIWNRKDEDPNKYTGTKEKGPSKKTIIRYIKEFQKFDRWEGIYNRALEAAKTDQRTPRVLHLGKLVDEILKHD